ncbi:MAG: DUF1476 domain-containing protein [Pseudomonadota bacterium]
MTSFDKKQKAHENKFALDESNLFKAEARACKNFGLWLGEKLGLSQEEAKSYAAKVVGANLEEPGFDDVVRFVKPDIKKASLSMTDEEINQKIEELFLAAQEEIKKEAA